MDKRYVTLFKDLAQATANSAEQVMEYNQSKNNEEGLQAVTTMRNDFQELFDTITKAGDDYIPTQPDSARLLIAAMIQMKQLQDKVDVLTKAIKGYQNDLIPKLQEIVEKAENDEMAHQMANEKFVIIENNK
jgi:hypothetical protein